MVHSQTMSAGALLIVSNTPPSAEKQLSPSLANPAFRKTQNLPAMAILLQGMAHRKPPYSSSCLSLAASRERKAHTHSDIIAGQAPLEVLQKPVAAAEGEGFFLKFTVQDKDYTIREAVSNEELWAAVWLRAQSFPAIAGHSQSSKRRFAEKEFSDLRRKLQAAAPRVCLIAVDLKLQEEGAPSIQRVVGTMDVSVSSHALHSILPLCGYIANVCVAPSARRQGIASSLIHSVLHLALDRWSLHTLFLHVESTNAPARLLYLKLGFHLVQEEHPSSKHLLCKSL